MCESDLSADDFPSKLFSKSASKSCFFRLASRSGFGAAISSAVARSSIVFCNSVSADCSVRAASRLLGATAACVILLSFAAGPLLRKCFKILFFFPLASRSGFGAAISSAVARSSIVFCNSVSADRSVRAASRLLGATAACIILLSFAAGHRKS